MCWKKLSTFEFVVCEQRCRAVEWSTRLLLKPWNFHLEVTSQFVVMIHRNGLDVQERPLSTALTGGVDCITARHLHREMSSQYMDAMLTMTSWAAAGAVWMVVTWRHTASPVGVEYLTSFEAQFLWPG